MSEDPNKMSFLQHLEELRWRLARIAIAIIVFAAAIFIFTEWIIDNIFLSMSKTDFVTFRLLCDYVNICVDDIKIGLQSTEMTNQFSTNMMLSIVGGIVCAFPYIFWEIWGFIKPGLRQNEAEAVKGLTFYVSILFFLGILLAVAALESLGLLFVFATILKETISLDLLMILFGISLLSVYNLGGQLLLVHLLFQLLFHEVHLNQLFHQASLH